MNKALYIDHTLLKAFSTEKDILRLCEEAKKSNFKSVCVNPCWVEKAHEFLLGSSVLVCTVIGFPLGANTIEVKAFEAENAILHGASEIDMVINISKAKEHDYEYIENEIKAVAQKCYGKTLKVIIETCYLTDEEKFSISQIVSKHAQFVKTSTGFGTSGATISDVKLLSDAVEGKIGVKASGGIKTLADFEAMVSAGATRIGTSNGVTIIKEDK